MGEERTASLFDDAASWATVSEDGLYRYDLGRRWTDGPLLGYVMCNPSTADDVIDDPTIRRCIGFAKREGLAGIVVRNLWAYRATIPFDVLAAWRAGVDIVGPENDGWLADLGGEGARFQVPRVVAAWGALTAFGRSRPVRDLIDARIHLVERTIGGRLVRFDTRGHTLAPHPGRIANACPLVPYPERRLAGSVAAHDAAAPTHQPATGPAPAP